MHNRPAQNEKYSCSSIKKFTCFAVAAVLAIAALTLRSAAQNTRGSEAQKSNRELQVQYAEARLALAKLKLQQSEIFNGDVSRSVATLVTLNDEERRSMLSTKRLSPAVIERLKSNVAIAAEQLQQLKTASTDSSEKVRLVHAEEDVRLAKIKLEAAVGKASKRSGQVNDLAVEEAKIKHELARLRLQILSHPDHLVDIVESLHFTTDRLSEELLALQQRVAALEDRSARQLTP